MTGKKSLLFAFILIASLFGGFGVGVDAVLAQEDAEKDGETVTASDLTKEEVLEMVQYHPEDYTETQLTAVMDYLTYDSGLSDYTQSELEAVNPWMEDTLSVLGGGGDVQGEYERIDDPTTLYTLESSNTEDDSTETETSTPDETETSTQDNETSGADSEQENPTSEPEESDSSDSEDGEDAESEEEGPPKEEWEDIRGQDELFVVSTEHTERGLEVEIWKRNPGPISTGVIYANDDYNTDVQTVGSGYSTVTIPYRGVSAYTMAVYGRGTVIEGGRTQSPFENVGNEFVVFLVGVVTVFAGILYKAKRRRDKEARKNERVA